MWKKWLFWILIGFIVYISLLLGLMFSQEREIKLPEILIFPTLTCWDYFGNMHGFTFFEIINEDAIIRLEPGGKGVGVLPRGRVFSTGEHEIIEYNGIIWASYYDKWIAIEKNDCSKKYAIIVEEPIAVSTYYIPYTTPTYAAIQSQKIESQKVERVATPPPNKRDSNADKKDSGTSCDAEHYNLVTVLLNDGEENTYKVPITKYSDGNTDIDKLQGAGYIPDDRSWNQIGFACLDDSWPSDIIAIRETKIANTIARQKNG